MLMYRHKCVLLRAEPALGLRIAVRGGVCAARVLCEEQPSQEAELMGGAVGGGDGGRGGRAGTKQELMSSREAS